MTDRKGVKLQLAVTSRSALPLRSAGGTQECRQANINLKI
jgi:hypothetical protein